VQSKNIAKDLVCLAGLAAFCAMLRAPFFGYLVTKTISSFATLRLAYDAFLVLFGLMLIFALISRLPSCSDEKRELLLALSGFLAALGAGAIIAFRSSVEWEILVFPSIVILCAGFAGLAAAWFAKLSTYPRERIPALALEAFVLSHLSGLVDALPPEAAVFASMAYPVISSACLLLTRTTAHQADAAPETERSQSFALDEVASTPNSAQDSVREEALPGPYFRRIRNGALCLIVVEVVCGCLLRSRWAHGGVGYDPTANSAVTYLVSLAIGLVFWMVVHRAKPAAEESLIIGALGMLGFTVATFLFSVLPISFLAPFVTGLYSALIVFMMALLVLWDTDGDTPSERAAGIFLVLYGSVSAVTTSIIPTLFSYQGTMPDEYLSLVGVIAGLVISFGVGAALFFMVVVHRDSYLSALKQAGFASSVDHATPAPVAFVSAAPDPAKSDPALKPVARTLHEQAMEKVAADFGLTEREKQTASLIALGYSVKSVAEELCVTPGTIQGYSKSIYRKMDVHKKDELIKIVDLAKHSL